jgi:hypothetical protein
MQILCTKIHCTVDHIVDIKCLHCGRHCNIWERCLFCFVYQKLLSLAWQRDVMLLVLAGQSDPSFLPKAVGSQTPNHFNTNTNAFLEVVYVLKTLNFSKKKKWLHASFRGEIVVDEEQWDNNIGSGLIARSNALGFGVTARIKNC